MTRLPSICEAGAPHFIFQSATRNISRKRACFGAGFRPAVHGAAILYPEKSSAAEKKLPHRGTKTRDFKAVIQARGLP
jgi:hypothetical protein